MKPCAEYFALPLVAFFVFAFAAGAQAQPAPQKGTQSLESTFIVPVGQGAKDVWLPDWEDGKLKMFLTVGEMQRKDIEHVYMTNAKIKTFDDNGKPDITLLLPVSIFDLETRLVITDKPFVLKRADLELMGSSLVMNTVTRQGTIIGKVKMIIYNFQEPPKKEPAHE